MVFFFTTSAYETIHAYLFHHQQTDELTYIILKHPHMKDIFTDEKQTHIGALLHIHACVYQRWN